MSVKTVSIHLHLRVGEGPLLLKKLLKTLENLTVLEKHQKVIFSRFPENHKFPENSEILGML